MENKKTTGKTALIVLLLIVTIVSLVLATYAWAKYTTTGNGTATAQVAKWNVTVNTDATTFTKTYTHVLDGRMAPGTAGQLDAAITIGTDTEVDVKYTVSIEEFKVEYAEAGATGTAAVPTNMIFKDSLDNVITHDKLVKGTELATKTVAAKTGATDDITVLKWEWPYETPGNVTVNGNEITADQADTLDGEKPVKITVVYRVDAVQVPPVAGN